MTASIFRHEISVKTTDCRHGNTPGAKIPPAVNLFVKVTNGCNAHCPFCSNAGAAHTTGPFDMAKLFCVIDELQRNHIIINRLNLTGGEPAVVAPLVEEILQELSKSQYDDIHVHLNTNGLLPTSQHLMQHPRFDSVSMSLHHYDRQRLSALYGTDISESALRFEGIDMMKLNASCNLIRGYIDTTAEAHRMMNFCLNLGITRLGFVALMKTNAYCHEHFIPLTALHLDTIPHCYFTESRNRGRDCCCSNYLYNSHGRVLDIYMRHYANPAYCESALLYDGKHLRQGFASDNIIF